VIVTNKIILVYLTKSTQYVTSIRQQLNVIFDYDQGPSPLIKVQVMIEDKK